MLRTMANTLGNRLRALRLSAGMTQQDTWERAEIPRTTYTDIEQGLVDNPSSTTLARIAMAIGVTMDHLLRDDVDRPSSAVAQFLATPIGKSLTAHEKAHILSAARQRPYPGKPIDLAYLYALTLAMRGHFRPEEVEERAQTNQGIRPRPKKM